MKSVPLGVSSLSTSRLAYGCWRIAGTWVPSEARAEDEPKGREAVIKAYEAGYTLFDNADIYCAGRTEKIFGDALKEVPGMREKIIIATKCGIRFPGDPKPDSPHRYDFSAEHIIRSCEGSLKRMGIETIDLYQLHRPDYLADPVEVAGAFAELKQAGKVRYFGVSNFRPTLVTALQSACPMPLIVQQLEISLTRLDCFTDGTLDQCLVEKLTPLAWSPLAGGVLADGGKPPETDTDGKIERILSAVDAVAKARGVNRVVIALAWLLKHPGKIVPIVGSTNPTNIAAAAKADDVELSREEWYTLLRAARGEKLP